MFTGIVEELGIIESIEDLGDSVRLTVRAERILEDVALGDSIAVNGCCLTVVSTVSTGSTDEDGGLTNARGATDAATWTADVMQETLDRTSLRGARPGDPVNLERAVTPTTRLGGHIVQGHVDGVGVILARTRSEHWEVVEVTIPSELSRYLVAKGSIAVDGVSLTVVSTASRPGAESFTVSLIPETLARTTLGVRKVGERVNLEVDVIAKHVERLLVARHLDHSTTEGIS